MDGASEPPTAGVAVVAALEREIGPWLKGWTVAGREYGGRSFRFFENHGRVAVCGGIGAAAARQATEAVIALYHPRRVLSVGFAGALQPGLAVGTVVTPARVIDARDGSRTEIAAGSGVLITVANVASPEQKAKLYAAYAAQAVDMEAAAVARGADARGIPFSAVKVISDDHGFDLPEMARFVTADGGFRTARFAAHIALRPWFWKQIYHLARNSSCATRSLCEWLRQNYAG